jgi:hypothetical protein
VYDSSPEHGIVALHGGHDANIQVGDPVWILSEHQPPAGGTTFFVSDQRSACRLHASIESPFAARSAAIIVRRQYISELQSEIPIGLTISGQITATLPEQGQAWINLGKFSGLRVTNNILIRRKQIPIARGEIIKLEDEKALLSLQPLVRNAQPRAEDTAELWPAPGNVRLHNINTYIITVRSADDGHTEIIVPGTADDGFAENSFANVFRNGRYVGTLLIEQIADPLSLGRWMEPLSRVKPEQGDRVVLRPPSDTLAYPLSAAVFQIDEGGYCMVATGEKDDIKHGETFVIRQPVPDHPGLWQDIAALNITKVNVDYSAGYVHPLRSESPTVEPWDIADRLKAPSYAYQVLGEVSAILPGTRSALVDGAELEAGQIARWVTAEDKVDTSMQYMGIGLIVAEKAMGAIMYVPPGWGDASLLPYARVDQLQVSSNDRLQRRKAPVTQPADVPEH